ncbi:MAG: hypothetical protein IJY24_01535, partial [Clostridia bacterium]|nr:hypothetical protein [Clostridia bacterium]
MKRLLILFLAMSLLLALLAGCENSEEKFEFNGTAADIEALESHEAKADKLREYSEQALKGYNAQELEATVEINLPASGGNVNGSTRAIANLHHLAESASLRVDTNLTIVPSKGSSSSSCQSREIYYTDGVAYLSSSMGDDLLPSLSAAMSYEEFCEMMVVGDGLDNEIPTSLDCEKVAVNRLADGSWHVSYSGVSGEVTRPFVRLASSLASFSGVWSYDKVDLALVYSEQFEPVEMSVKIIYATATGSEHTPITLKTVSSYYITSEEAPGTSLIAKDSYERTDNLLAGARLERELNDMLLGKYDILNVSINTEYSDTTKNTHIKYALTIQDIEEAHLEITERGKEDKARLYIYRGFKLIKGLESNNGMAYINDPVGTDTTPSAAYADALALTNPTSFSLSLVSKIEESNGRYTVHLDNAALALVGVKYSDSYAGSGITYGFNIEDGEITNLVVTIKLYYKGNLALNMIYRYTTGLDSIAPP